MRIMLERLIHIFRCKGPVIGMGFVADPKSNHDRKVLRGFRKIHRCETCQDVYATDEGGDLVDPYSEYRGE